MKTLNFSDARHLISRTGLGIEWNHIKNMEGRTKKEAIDIIINTNSSRLPSPPRMTAWSKLERLRAQDPHTKMQAWVIATREGSRLRQWWLKHLLKTKNPFLERMTLFWHNHFTSSNCKTLQPSFLYQQNKTLRQHALGNFRNLLHAMARDPAMLVYLDGCKNVKGQPNENFARELLELFTLGRGQYSERDIKVVAKVFTGWGINKQRGTFFYDKNKHDHSIVNFMGHKGRLTGNQVLDILLRSPKTTENICKKFWKAFVNETPPPRHIIIHWGKQFRKSNYDIKHLVKTILLSDEFWARRNRNTLTKSPIELIIGAARSLPYRGTPIRDIENISRLLGQELFDPPNVKGWIGGKNWINTHTLLLRTSWMTKFTRGSLNWRVVNHFSTTIPQVPEKILLEWILAARPSKPLSNLGKKRLIRTLVLDPAYQLA